MKHLILATAGHVDHGKTALIKALTGTDTDRLPEEKARGITIDLGFAHLQLGEVSLGIIDVPGHEDFVKNMVAGMGAIDLALLVVAADDSWMPQTEEHLQILEYLGVEHGVVALTKSDLVEPPEEEIREKLGGTFLENAPLVSVSTKSGRGLDHLREELARICQSIPEPRDIGKPRLFVDRSFLLHGIGTVVTGTLTGGRISRGDEMIVQPSGARVRIRSTQTHNRDVATSIPGTRTALNVVGENVERGQVMARAGLGEPSLCVDVVVRRSRRLPPGVRAIRSNEMVRVHHGSAHGMARLVLLEGEELRAGDTALAQLRFDRDVFLFAADRVVLRDGAGRTTVAGAMVLDPVATPKDCRSHSRKKFLCARAKEPRSALAFAQTQLERDHILRRATALAQSVFSASEIVKALPGNEFAFDPEWWAELKTRAGEMIESEHRDNPNHLGLNLARLREAIGPALPFSEGFDELLVALEADGFERHGELIRKSSHRPSLPRDLAAAGDRIRAALKARPFDPPSRKDLAPDPSAQSALRFLRDSREVVEISSDLVLDAEALELMKLKILQALSPTGSNVSELRQAIGTSRRVIIPLLEYFDRLGVTRRVGDKRVAGSSSARL